MLYNKLLGYLRYQIYVSHFYKLRHRDLLHVIVLTRALYSVFRKCFEKYYLSLYRTPTVRATGDVRWKIGLSSSILHQ